MVIVVLSVASPADHDTATNLANEGGATYLAVPQGMKFYVEPNVFFTRSDLAR